MTAVAVKLACKGVWKLFGPESSGFPAHHSKPPDTHQTIHLAGRELA